MSAALLLEKKGTVTAAQYLCASCRDASTFAPAAPGVSLRKRNEGLAWT